MDNQDELEKNMENSVVMDPSKRKRTYIVIAIALLIVAVILIFFYYAGNYLRPGTQNEALVPTPLQRFSEGVSSSIEIPTIEKELKETVIDDGNQEFVDIRRDLETL